MNDPMNFEAINLEMQVGKNERKKIQAVNQVLSRIRKESIDGANLLILVTANAVAELLGKKRSNHENNIAIPWWKRCIQTKIPKLRRHVVQLQEWNRGEHCRILIPGFCSVSKSLILLII